MLMGSKKDVGDRVAVLFDYMRYCTQTAIQ
jgi:hypothetical protein